MNSNTNDKSIAGGGESGLVVDGLSSAAERSQNTNSSSSSRKRPFNIMLDGNDDTHTAAAAESSTNTNDQALSRANILQQNSDMRIELNTAHNKRVELEQRCIELTKRNQELEIKVKDLTLKNEYNEWKYTAEDIPDFYWSEQGFNEEYIRKMNTWLAKMKKSTDLLRRGDPMENLNISNGGTNTIIHLFHDDILLTHWKEFADALVQYQKFNHRENYGIERLFTWNIEFDREVLDMLAPILKTTAVKKLSFGGYDFGSEMVSFVADILEASPHIQGIGLYNNRIDSVDDMRRFCKSITDRNSDINTVEARLFQSFDGNNPEMMRMVLDASHQLEKLFLKNNGIGNVGTDLIANFLASNPPMKELDLTGNNLNDTDATLLANTLQSNTNLKRLQISSNDITDIGRKALLESVFNISSLNACVATNHTCHIHGLTPDISDINKYTKALNRTMKIFTMLAATDDGFFNMNCLGDLSYKLIPDVLRLAQKFRGKTPALSEAYFEQTGQRSADWNKLVDKKTVPITSLFELLRGWAVPSLA